MNPSERSALAAAVRASFEIVSVAEDVITLRDLDGPVSVTNDAEAVVASVIEWKGAFNNAGRPYRIFYFDTSGDRDELVHDRGKFLRFAPGRL